MDKYLASYFKANREQDPRKKKQKLQAVYTSYNNHLNSMVGYAKKFAAKSYSTPSDINPYNYGNRRIDKVLQEKNLPSIAFMESYDLTDKADSKRFKDGLIATKTESARYENAFNNDMALYKSKLEDSAYKKEQAFNAFMSTYTPMYGETLEGQISPRVDGYDSIEDMGADAAVFYQGLEERFAVQTPQSVLEYQYYIRSTNEYNEKVATMDPAEKAFKTRHDKMPKKPVAPLYMPEVQPWFLAEASNDEDIAEYLAGELEKRNPVNLGIDGLDEDIVEAYKAWQTEMFMFNATDLRTEGERKLDEIRETEPKPPKAPFDISQFSEEEIEAMWREENAEGEQLAPSQDVMSALWEKQQQIIQESILKTLEGIRSGEVEITFDEVTGEAQARAKTIEYQILLEDFRRRREEAGIPEGEYDASLDGVVNGPYSGGREPAETPKEETPEPTPEVPVDIEGKTPSEINELLNPRATPGIVDNRIDSQLEVDEYRDQLAEDEGKISEREQEYMDIYQSVLDDYRENIPTGFKVVAGSNPDGKVIASFANNPDIVELYLNTYIELLNEKDYNSKSYFTPKATAIRNEAEAFVTKEAERMGISKADMVRDIISGDTPGSSTLAGIMRLLPDIMDAQLLKNSKVIRTDKGIFVMPDEVDLDAMNNLHMISTPETERAEGERSQFNKDIGGITTDQLPVYFYSNKTASKVKQYLLAAPQGFGSVFQNIGGLLSLAKEIPKGQLSPQEKAGATKAATTTKNTLVDEILLGSLQAVGQMGGYYALGASLGGSSDMGAFTKILSKTPFFLSAAGGYMEEARQDGADQSERVAYALIGGAIEGYLESQMFGLLTGQNAMAKGLSRRLLKKGMSKFGYVGAKYMISGISEGVEEATAEVIMPLLKVLYGGDTTIKLDEVAKSAAIGAISGMIFSTAGLGQESKNYQAVTTARDALLKGDIEPTVKNIKAFQNGTMELIQELEGLIEQEEKLEEAGEKSTTGNPVTDFFADRDSATSYEIDELIDSLIEIEDDDIQDDGTIDDIAFEQARDLATQKVGEALKSKGFVLGTDGDYTIPETQETEAVETTPEVETEPVVEPPVEQPPVEPEVEVVPEAEEIPVEEEIEPTVEIETTEITPEEITEEPTPETETGDLTVPEIEGKAPYVKVGGEWYPYVEDTSDVDTSRYEAGDFVGYGSLGQIITYEGNGIFMEKGNIIPGYRSPVMTPVERSEIPEGDTITEDPFKETLVDIPETEATPIEDAHTQLVEWAAEEEIKDDAVQKAIEMVSAYSKDPSSVDIADLAEAYWTIRQQVTDEGAEDIESLEDPETLSKRDPKANLKALEALKSIEAILKAQGIEIVYSTSEIEIEGDQTASIKVTRPTIKKDGKVIRRGKGVAITRKTPAKPITPPVSRPPVSSQDNVVKWRNISFETKENGSVVYSGPYNAEFVKGMNGIGARWSSVDKTWTFQKGAMNEFTSLLKNIFYYGSPLGTVRVKLTPGKQYHKRMIAAGMPILSKTKSADGGVRMPLGTSIIEGDFSNGKGSVYIVVPSTGDAILEISDFPMEALQDLEKFGTIMTGEEGAQDEISRDDSQGDERVPDDGTRRTPSEQAPETPEVGEARPGVEQLGEPRDGDIQGSDTPSRPVPPISTEGDEVTGVGSIEVDGEGSLDASIDRDIHIIKKDKTVPTSTNFEFSEDYVDEYGKGGEVTIYTDNVNAIRLLKNLEMEKRVATKEEQEVLAKYRGWGGVKSPFDRDNFKWATRRNQLMDLLSDAELSAASNSIQNAHYTSPEVISKMYEILSRLGFKSGSILEPGMGVGNFFGMMPKGMRQSSLYGVELDNITGRIAQKLYPDANIQVKGYQDTKFQDDSIDVAIGNVPFASLVPYDPKYKKLKLPLHDYYFAKTMDAVRPGGLVMFITSHYTADKQRNVLRKLMSEQANLVGAIRLPNTAFKGVARTSVTTDIIILQKKGGETEIEGANWIKAVKYKGTNLNEYFEANPNMVLGDMSVEGSMYSDAPEITVNPSGVLSEQLSEVLESFPENIYSPRAIEIPAPSILKDTNVEGFEHLKAWEKVNGAMIIQDGDVYQRDGGKDGTYVKVEKVSKANLEKLTDYMNLRNTYLSMVEKFTQDPKSDVSALRANLNTIYDEFVEKYGYLNEKGTKKFISQDKNYGVISALENLEKGKFIKSDMFSMNNLTVFEDITPESIGEATWMSIDRTGELNYDYMKNILDYTDERMEVELPKIAFKDHNGKWIENSEYLSGDIYDKIDKAKLAYESDNSYKRNIDALEEVIPELRKMHEIAFQIGSGFISPEMYQRFANEHMGFSTWQIRHNKFTNEYEVVNSEATYGTKARELWGTQDRAADKVFQGMLNNTAPKITVDKKLDYERTEVLRMKTVEIQTKFNEWVLSTRDVSTELADRYNKQVNRIAKRDYSNLKMTFPGMASDIVLRPHQDLAVKRGVVSGNTLLAHTVGSGKTHIITAIAMKKKQLGLQRKPLIVVPNSLIGQWEMSIREIYPLVNLLVVNEFSAKGRQVMSGRIANNEWDIVLTTKNTFTAMGMSPQYQTTYIRKQLSDLQSLLAEMKSAGEIQSSIAQIEAAIDKYEAQLLYMRDNMNSADGTVWFDGMGIDGIYVDEAHNYKNLYFKTKLSRIPGISPGKNTAGQNFDMHMKTSYLNELHGADNGVVFATGTPISNSMSEAFTMMKYLAPRLLEKTDMTFFDNWFNIFALRETSIELSSRGMGFKSTERVKKYANLPELLNMMGHFTDFVTADKLKLKVPKLENGEYNLISVETHPALDDYINKIAEREAKIKGSGRPQKGEDNYLTLTNDALMSAIDMRLVDPNAEDFEDSRLNTAIKKIFEEWQIGTDATDASKNTTQIVFLDKGVPGGSAKINLYQDIIKKLVNMGVPRSEIDYMHKYKKDDRHIAFSKLNSGETRILIGSTPQMGEGMNAQAKMKALHHIDIPWRASDLEQRNGRIIRPGNSNEEVRIYNYATLGTADAFVWNLIENKAKMADTLMHGSVTNREMDDVFGTLALTSAQFKAWISKNPLLMDKAELELKLKALEVVEKDFIRKRSMAQEDLGFLEKEVPRLEQQRENAVIDAANTNDIKGSKFKMTIKGVEYTAKAKTDATAALFEIVKNANPKKPLKIGEIAGIDLYVLQNTRRDEATLAVHGAGTYSVSFNYSVSHANGTMQRLTNLVDRVGTDKQVATKLLDKTKSDLDTTRYISSSTFVHANEIAALRSEMQDLDKRIVEAAKDPSNQPPKDESIIEQEAQIDEGDVEIADKRTELLYMPGDSLTTGQVQTTISDVVDRKKHVTPGQVSKVASKAFGLPMSSTNFRRKHASGFYNVRGEFMKARALNDIDTMLHELGHHLDKQYSLQKIPAIRSLLNNYVKRLPASFVAGYSKAELPGEAAAEFLSLFIVSPDKAKKADMQLFKMIEGMLSIDHLNGVESVRSLIRKYDSLTLVDKADDSIVPTGEKEPIDVKHIVKLAYMNQVDDLAGFGTYQRVMDKVVTKDGGSLSPAENVTYLSSNSRKADMIAKTILTKKMVNPAGELIGISLHDAIGKFANKKEYRHFLVYLKNNIAYDWAAQGKIVYDAQLTAYRTVNGKPVVDMSKIDLIQAELNNKYPEFANKAQSLYDTWDLFVRTWLVDEKLLDEVTYEKLRDRYPHYVPNFRVVSTHDAAAGMSKFGNTKVPLRYASKKGSALRTYDPIESLILQTGRVINATKRNEVIRVMADIAEKSPADASEFFIPVPPDLSIDKVNMQAKKLALIVRLNDEIIQGTFSNADKASYKARRSNTAKIDFIIDWKLSQSGTDAETRDLFRSFITMEDKVAFAIRTGYVYAGDIVNDVISDIEISMTPVSSSDNPAIISYIDRAGNRKWIEILNPYLLKSLTNLDREELPSYLRKMNQITRTVKNLTTTMSPLYSIFSNFPRDTVMFYINTKSNFFQATKSLVWAWAEIFRSDVLKQDRIIAPEYGGVGGGHASKNATNLSGLQYSMSKMMKHKGFKSMLHNGQIALETFADMIENGPRLATYIYNTRMGGNQNTYENRVKGLNDANEITINFGRQGTHSRHLDAIIPYYGAGVQAIDKMRRMLIGKEATTGKRVGAAVMFARKAVTSVGLMTLIQYFMHRDDEDYERLARRVKDAYWIFGKDEKGTFKKVPKPQEMVLFSALIERSLDALLKEDPEAFDGLGKTIVNYTFPPMRFIFSPINDVRRNAAWHGAPIEPEWYDLANVPQSQRYDERTSEIGKWIGKALKVSPKMTDYLIQQYTGIAGQILLPIFTESKGVSAIGDIVARRLTADPIYTNDVLNSFYEAEEIISGSFTAGKTRDTNTILMQVPPNKASGAERKLLALKQEILNTKKLMKVYRTKLADAEGDIEKERALRMKIIKVAGDTYQNWFDYKEEYNIKEWQLK